MKPKKGTKYVSHKEHQEYQKLVLDMPPAAR